MLDWQDLVRLPDDELARHDIAAVNLACAVGLPGSDTLDHDGCLRTIAERADRCGGFTERVMPVFRSGRCDYPESEGRFRVQAMVTHLQRDLGVRYHPDRIAEDAVFRPEDSFVHGVTHGDGGTCGNLPIVYAAVGRRLGYPIFLASTRGHLYCRWEGGVGGEAFNIEAAGLGISFFEDEYYRTDRYAMPPKTIAACGYLQSLSPREELASFLCQRGECWMQERNYREATTAFAWANELDPRRQQHGYLTWQAIRVWKETLQSRLPSRLFPKLDLGLPPRQFGQMPPEAEREIIALRVLEGFLDDPEYHRRWWVPLAQNPGQRPQGMPQALRVDFRWNRIGRDKTLAQQGS